MMSVSLRRSTLLWMTGLLSAVGLVTMLIAFWFVYREAAEFLDGQLRQIALNAGPGMVGADAPGSPDEDPEDQFAITIWGADGRVVHASLPNVQIPRQRQSGYANVRAVGDLWRVYTIRAASRTVQVAQRDTVREEIARSTAMGAAAPIIIVIPLSWLVVGWAMNQMFGRLNTLANGLAKRSAAAAEPIPLAGIPTEVVPLVWSMNGLIARLQAALTAQKRFLADAAHELRTPLAAMQIQVDTLASSTPTTLNERRAALASGVRRASALINQLLELARLDEPVASSSEAIELGPLLLECVGDHVPIAQAKGVDIGVDIISPATIHGAVGEVRTLLGNLIDNAVRYTPAGEKIDVSLYRRNNRNIAEVLDTGPGLPKGTEARVFDRFYRAAPAGVEGTGLGLAIARQIADRNGFGLTVENRKDGLTGVAARVSIPAARSLSG
ncbi:MAG: two-component sensor histidine kinase [Proteobacteria bacterium]|nr:two-component sensor histidine kinase [Pseudomonadota bacterium]